MCCLIYKPSLCLLSMLNNTAFNVNIGEEVAIKLESVKSKSPQLLRETKIYRSLNGIGEIMHACIHTTIHTKSNPYHLINIA